MKKVVFLDRDGTINVDHGYVHEIDKFEFTHGAQEALKSLQSQGYVLAIVTNQSGIAAGYYKVSEMETLHDYMTSELAKVGVKIDVIAYCPHGRDGDCDCRKPGIGMIEQIEGRLGDIDYARSWTIGDKEADMMMGKAAGTKTALVASRYWQEEELTAKPDLMVKSLWEFAEGLKNEMKKGV